MFFFLNHYVAELTPLWGFFDKFLKIHSCLNSPHSGGEFVYLQNKNKLTNTTLFKILTENCCVLGWTNYVNNSNVT